MSREKQEQEIGKKLNNLLQGKEVDEIVEKRDELSTALHKLPWFAYFFEETEIEGYTFLVEENRYEILKKERNRYIVQDRQTQHIAMLPTSLEEKKYVLGGSFSLDNV